MNAARKKARQVETSTVDVTELSDRVDTLASAVARLLKLLEDPDTVQRPEPKLRKTVPRPLSEQHQLELAQKARAGRAAKRLGMSFKDYVAKYGLVDSPKLAEKPKRKRSKRAASG